MLNIEKYKDKLVELCVIDIDRLALIQGQPRICNSSLLCNECLFNNNIDFCSGEALNWLFSEYKEPEVDWSKVKVDTPIYVRDCETDSNGDEKTWVPRHFAKFENGTAYDVDKVVEQLGKKQNNKGFGGTIQEIFYDLGLENAIEIVKGGGIDGNTNT